MIESISRGGFLLDTCYDEKRFRKLYGEILGLLRGCGEHVEKATALIIAVTHLKTFSVTSVSWLYELLSTRLDLPPVPWPGDTIALIYAVGGVLESLPSAQTISLDDMAFIVKCILQKQR